MYSYRDFTFDHVRYKDLPDFVNELHSKNIKYVPIIDAGIAMREKGQYPAYDLGRENDIFIKVEGKTLIG